MTPDRDFIAAIQSGIPPIGTPDPIADLETSEGLLGLQSDNCDIDVSESVYFPIPSDLPTLSPDEIAEGDARQEHC